MAKSGSPSQLTASRSRRTVDTRRALVDGAIATLQAEGFAGASARSIAERAGVTQGLIFYHYGSVANLLLAALDFVSAERMAAYSEAVATTTTPAELVDVAVRIFRDDLDAGYVTVLAEMIGGASSTPGLGVEVAARIGPWFTFAETAVERTLGDSPLAALLPSHDVAYGIVALYLGLEMLTHLDGDRERALQLFSRAQELAPLLALLSPPSKEPA